MIQSYTCAFNTLSIIKAAIIVDVDNSLGSSLEMIHSLVFYCGGSLRIKRERGIDGSLLKAIGRNRSCQRFTRS